MTDKPSYYGILPANVRYNSKLSPSSRLLYCEITALCGMRGECTATNQYFADLYDTTPSTVSRWVSELENERLISVSIVKATGNIRNIKIPDAVFSNKRAIRKNDDRAIRKNEDTYTQKAQDPIRKKRIHNTSTNVVNTTPNGVERSITDDYENQPGSVTDFAKRKTPPSSAPPPLLFADTKYSDDLNQFKTDLLSSFPDCHHADIDYYFNRCKNWSSASAGTSRNWLHTANSFIQGDISKGIFKTHTHATSKRSNNSAKRSLTTDQLKTSTMDLLHDLGKSNFK